MPAHRDLALQFAQQNDNLFIKDLESLLAKPSISTLPENRCDIDAAAENAADILREIGMEAVHVMPTAGHPVVYGEWLGAGSSAPTVLIYAHYDVQPVDPLELWESDPFTPTIRGDYLFARGASDMKGQLIAACSAIRSITRFDPLPVNVKFIIEGEEEIGSPNLRKFLEQNKDLLACTFSLNPDAGMVSPKIPAIIYSLRGLVFFELKITGPDHDLHSGIFGGIVHNPAVALAEILAQLHDANGKIAIPGYYEHVRELSSEERRELARLPMNDPVYLAQTGAPMLWGEKGYTPTERIGARPTLEINGMMSGFTGNGTKTVLPAYALAKISSRIVADQTPDDLHHKFRAYLEKIIPPTVQWELTFMGGSLPSATDPNNPYTAALEKALETVWGVRPVYKREGGSVPVVGDFQKILGADSILTGFGLPDDCIHSPNERLHLPTWRRGIEALIHFFYNL